MRGVWKRSVLASPAPAFQAIHTRTVVLPQDEPIRSSMKQMRHETLPLLTVFGGVIG